MPDITIPAQLRPADGRFGSGPSKVPSDARRGPGRARTNCSAPATASRRSRAWSAACASGLRELFDLPDGYEVVLGNGGSTAFWDAAAFGLIERARPARRLRRVLGQVRGGHRRRAVPRRAGGPCGATGTRRRAGCRATASTPTPGRTTRPRPAWCCRCSGSRTDGALMLVDATVARRGHRRSTSRRPTSTTSRRRRASPSEGGLWLALFSPAAIERAAAAQAAARWVPASLDLTIAIDNSREGPDLQHPGDRDAVAARRPGRAGCWHTAAWPGPRRARADSSAPAVRLGRASVVRDAVRRRSGLPQPGGRHDRLRRASTPPRSRRRCAPTASSTPSPTADWAATSCASACTPPSTPTTSRR